jgi:hypothetical protein
VGKVLNRLNQDDFGSHYSYKGATDAVTMKIRHATDSVDKSGVVMLRHNVFVERVVYATPTEFLKKQSFTWTLRGGEQEDPVLASNLAIGTMAWLSASTNAALLGISVGEN